MRSRLCLLIAMMLVATACTSNSPEAVTTPAPEQPTGAGDGWEAVDHPVVVAVRGSASIEPASKAIDGSEDTSWNSGEDAPQWIEFDLGAPVDISKIRLTVDQAPAGLTIHEIRAGAHDNPGRLAATIKSETDWGDRLEAIVGYEAEFIRITTTESPSRVAWVEVEIDVDE